LLLALALTSHANPPTTNEVERYERDRPIFRSRAISRELGDALLSALDGGQALQRWQVPAGILAQPIPPRHWLNIVLTNGQIHPIGISHNGGLVYSTNGLWQVTQSARQQIAVVVGQLEEELKREITSTPKPLVYSVGTVRDGGTLSGIAKLFYGKPAKWTEIFEANGKTLKNPDLVRDGMQLTIPKPE
jgi:hypothetical protein